LLEFDKTGTRMQKNNQKNLLIWFLTYLFILIGGFLIGFTSLPYRPLILLTSEAGLIPESIISALKKNQQVHLKVIECQTSNCIYENIPNADFFLVTKKWGKEFRPSELLEVRSPDFTIDTNFASTSLFKDQMLPWIWRYYPDKKAIVVYYLMVKNLQGNPNPSSANTANTIPRVRWPLKKYQLDVLRFLSDESTMFLWTKMTDFSTCLQYKGPVIPTHKKPEGLREIPLKNLHFIENE
jgi:hypothetical protein